MRAERARAGAGSGIIFSRCLVTAEHRPQREPSEGAAVEQRVIPSGVLAVIVGLGVVLFLALVLWANQAG